MENEAQKDLSQYGEIIHFNHQENLTSSRPTSLEFGDNSRKERMAFVMRYNPPWTPPFMRRNEVALLVNR
ncbi:MAG: heme-binding protein [Methanothrix sp.]